MSDLPAVPPRPAAPTLRARLLSIGRWLWLACALFWWALWLASVPVFLQRAAAGNLPAAAVGSGQVPSLLAAERAASWGVTVPVWSWINVILSGLTLLLPTLLALLIWHRRRDGFGLFTAFVLLGTGSEPMNVAVYGGAVSAVVLAVWELGVLIWPAFLLWLYLFPNGRPVPRRMAWILFPLVALAYVFFGVALIAGWWDSLGWQPLAARLQPVAFGLIMVVFAMTIVSQIYRYLAVSGPVERRQTLWFVLSVAVYFCLSPVLDLLKVPAEIASAAFLLVPVGVAVSILRYRLWDIDVIIRKTLVYAVLSGMLALVYFGSVILLQGLLGQMGATQSPLIIVASTLLIAALFSPLRQRVQTFIDRRFYRRKYNAEQMLAEFAQTTRAQVELDELTAELLRVVEQSVQPAAASVWLRERERD